jgi:hypothetical protein
MVEAGLVARSHFDHSTQPGQAAWQQRLWPNRVCRASRQIHPPRTLQHCDISHVAWALWGLTSLMSLHGEWGVQQGLSQDFPTLNWGLHRQLPNLPATRRRQDLHPPHVSVVVGNLASELLSCAPDHKCLCLTLPWKLISSRFLGMMMWKKGETKPTRKGRQGDWQLLAATPSPLQLKLCFWQPLGHPVQPLPDHAVPVPHQC